MTDDEHTARYERDGRVLAARDAVAARWADALGDWWALERANAAATPLRIDPEMNAHEVCRTVLTHGRDALGLVLRTAQIEALADAGARVWREMMGGDGR